MTDHRSTVYGYGTSRDGGGGGGSEGSPRKAAAGSAVYAEAQPRKITAGGAVYAEANKPSRNLHTRHSIHFDTLDHALTGRGVSSSFFVFLNNQNNHSAFRINGNKQPSGPLESPLDANIYMYSVYYTCTLRLCIVLGV